MGWDLLATCAAGTWDHVSLGDRELVGPSTAIKDFIVRSKSYTVQDVSSTKSANLTYTWMYTDRLRESTFSKRVRGLHKDLLLLGATR
jgi:hypothetical protein